MTAPAALVIGFNLHGKGGDLGHFYADPNGPAAMAAAKIPPCVLLAAEELEEGAVAFDAATQIVRIAVRGAGLRGPADACFRALLPGATIAEEGNVTRYHAGKEDVFVLWRGSSLAVAAIGPGVTAATLTEARAPLLRDDRARSLLAKVDTSQWYWFAVDGKQLDEERSLPFRLETVSGTIEDKAMRMTVDLASADDAVELSSMAKAALAQAPAAVKAIAGDVTVAVDGTSTRFTMSYGSALRMAGVTQTDLPPGVAPTFGLGLLAGVAVPALLQNARKAKATEAVVNVKRLYEGAFAQYGFAHELPSSTGITPRLGVCCAGNDRRCAPDASLWDTPAWKALRFSVDDPHYYSYEFTSDKSSFTARAYGDLNCDGVYSTFEMKGTIAADGSITTGRLETVRELD